MSPLPVSIIVNNHNYGRFLGAAIDSALAQDHPAVEVVVVDDGSTDESRAVIAGYGDRVVAVLQPNGGQGAAFNAGFAACRGQVVNFLDADDLLAPDAARRAALAFAADAGLSQWLAPLEMIDAAGRPLHRTYPGRPLPAGDVAWRTLRHGPWAYQTVHTSGNFWSRAFLERVLPLPAEQYRIGGDEYLSPLAGLYGRLASDGRPAGCYRHHGGNAYWRGRLDVDDVAADSFSFRRIAGLIGEHARRLGLHPDPQSWPARDWRQQVRRLVLHRAGRDSLRPPPPAVLGAVWRDQTRPLRKVALVPAVAALYLLPAASSIRLGLRLLDRG